MTDHPKTTNSDADADVFRPETLAAQLGRHRRACRDWVCETGNPQKVFWLSVACYLIVMTLMTQGLLWMNTQWGFAWEDWWDSIFTAVIGIKTQWTGVATIQIVFWWQFRYPKRPPLWQFCVLAVALILLSSTTELLPWNWEMPLPLLGYMVGYALAGLAIYLFIIRTISTVICFWFVSTVGEKAHASQPRETAFVLPPKPGGWSIRGLFLTTLLSAVLIVLVRLGFRALESLDGSIVEIDFQWILVVSGLLELLVTVLIAFAAAWHSIRPSWWIVVGAIGAAVGLRYSGQIVAQAIITPQTGVAMMYPSIVETTMSYSATMLLHWICFRLWRHAGFELIGWTRHGGYRTARMTKSEPSQFSAPASLTPE